MSLPFHRPKLTMVRERIIRPANAVYVTFSSLAEATIARSISYASVCKCIERLANSSCFSGRVARLLISAASDAFLRRPSRWILVILHALSPAQALGVARQVELFLRCPASLLSFAANVLICRTDCRAGNSYRFAELVWNDAGFGDLPGVCLYPGTHEALFPSSLGLSGPGLVEELVIGALFDVRLQ